MHCMMSGTDAQLEKQKSWKPKRHVVFKDVALTEELHERGYALHDDFIRQEELASLRSLYTSSHDFGQSGTGFFCSIYSADLDYRRKVHDEINKILNRVFKSFFTDYKPLLNIFLVKTPGRNGEFKPHQDATFLDENRFSPLNLWIPLVDTTSENGTLAVIEKSHTFFGPYRSNFVPQPFENIFPAMRKYLKPVDVKAGQALFFDPRIIHSSLPNLSNKDRPVVACTIVPQAASLTRLHAVKEREMWKVQLPKLPDDFLVTVTNILNEKEVLYGKELLKEDRYIFTQVSAKDFISRCAANNIEDVNFYSAEEDMYCPQIGEPIPINPSQPNTELTTGEPLENSETANRKEKQSFMSFLKSLLG